MSTILFLYLKHLPHIPCFLIFPMPLVSLHLDLVFFRYDLFPKNTCFRLGFGLVTNPRFLSNCLWNCNAKGFEFQNVDIRTCFGSGFLACISQSLYKKNCSESSKMNRFVQAGLEERALIPNVMQQSPKNNIKRAETDNKRVRNALTMNDIDKY